MIHPQTQVQRRSAEVGAGVFATQPLPKGTLIWVKDPLDKVITMAEFLRWPKEYAAVLQRTGVFVHGEIWQTWDHARMMNHSCTPNCGGTARGFELALRDIAKGEELTNDYAEFCMPGEPQFPCRCGAPCCRGDAPFNATSPEQAALQRAIEAAVACMDFVPQPLASLRKTEGNPSA